LRTRELKTPIDEKTENNEELAKVIGELREKNEEVPEPLRLPTVEEVTSAEEKLGVEFPGDYRVFLLTASDIIYGALEPALLTDPDSGDDLVRLATEGWERVGIPRELLPICEDNADYYCMNEAGEILFWETDGLTGEKWKNMAEWIRKVWIEEGHVRDVSGGMAED
jgi:hypothetical protein